MKQLKRTIVQVSNVIVPKRVMDYAYAYKAYWSDVKRYKSFAIEAKTSQQNLIGAIILKYHVLEKGLTMPQMKPGFGSEVIHALITLCTTYMAHNYDRKNVHFVHTVRILNEYLKIHKALEHELNPDLVAKINALSEETSIKDNSKQLSISDNEYFKHSYSAFEDFATSRHSIREFTPEEVDVSVLLKAVQLAQKSPSSCNRQPNRVYIITDPAKIETVLAAQMGNRGFGHLINKVILLTAEVSVFSGYGERNEAFINSGLFAMSLLYGLHYYKIGALPLAYIAVSTENDLKIRKICGIPDSEVATMFIGCGHVPEKLAIASSPRYDTNEITTIVQ